MVAVLLSFCHSSLPSLKLKSPRIRTALEKAERFVLDPSLYAPPILPAGYEEAEKAARDARAAEEAQDVDMWRLTPDPPARVTAGAADSGMDSLEQEAEELDLLRADWLKPKNAVEKDGFPDPEFDVSSPVAGSAAPASLSSGSSSASATAELKDSPSPTTVTAEGKTLEQASPLPVSKETPDKPCSLGEIPLPPTKQESSGEHCSAGERDLARRALTSRSRKDRRRSHPTDRSRSRDQLRGQCQARPMYAQ